MDELRFEWNDEKAAANYRKHRVRFEEAETVWDDLYRVEAPDEEHSEAEDRWITIGLSSRFQLLTVAYTERNEKIRLITDRRASKAEEGRYTGEA